MRIIPTNPAFGIRIYDADLGDAIAAEEDGYGYDGMLEKYDLPDAKPLKIYRLAYAQTRKKQQYRV